MPYHVRITSRDPRRRSHDALALDKDRDWIEEHIIAPRRAGRDIFLDGQVFSWDSIDEIHITETDQTSDQLLPGIRARRRDQGGGLTWIPDRWYVARDGRDVTELFITGPPGTGPQPDPSPVTSFGANRKAVMVIYGHDADANTALFDWLRAIGLQPQEWSQLVHASGSASPYVGDILKAAFKKAQAVIAYFTPDEHIIARNAPPDDEKSWRLQARPNVLIEAGMALITHPTRTVLAVLGHQELPSDLAGRHYVRLSHTQPQPLHDLAARLHDAGCQTDLSGTAWLNPARFPDRSGLSASAPLTPSTPESSDAARARRPLVDGPRARPRPVVLKIGDQHHNFDTDFTAGCEGNLVINDEYADDRHARFRIVRGIWYVQDLDSTNGTFHNGRRIHAAVTLKKRDMIKIGHTTVIVVSV